uniref:C2H2-type domain-containing protein n=1 Tax=Lates calcarifer TaxID=8187 RepID=A0A4W6CJQ5_LATCA
CTSSPSEGEQLQRLEEADNAMFTPEVKSEDDDGDKAQSSQLHHRQTEEERDVEVEAGGSDPDKTLNPGTCLQPESAARADHKRHPQEHSEIQKGEKPFGCSVCGKRYHQGKLLIIHSKLHSKEKRHFKRSGDVGCTEEKPFSCSLCGKRFEKSYNLIAHVRVHTGEKPFTCSVCKTCFKTRHALMNHMRIHTGEKPFRCSVCGKRFVQSGSLKQHTSVHTEEKPYSCNACDKRFSLLTYLRRHKCHSL